MTAQNALRILGHYSKNVAPVRDRIDLSATYTTQFGAEGAAASTPSPAQVPPSPSNGVPSGSWLGEGCAVLPIVDGVAAWAGRPHTQF